jgi:geranylgeranyl pyrophosphate synthase
MFPTITINGSSELAELLALYRREMPNPNSSLASAANYHFKKPGKSFRAQLALSTGHSLGLSRLDNLHWAAACELLHNASLIHDDISDSSTHRRGQESIHNHFGSDMALCLGDWMIAKAFELGARNSRNGGALVALLAQAMQDTCNGQISDITQRECSDLAEWQRIATGKTAPLLVAPIRGAAIAASLNKHAQTIKRLEGLEYIISLCGLAYQGRNDIEDIIPSSHHSSDLEGRKPNLVVSLFAHEGQGCAEFVRWYASEDMRQVPYWQRRIASSDAILHANQSVDDWLLQAEKRVTSLPIELQSVTQSLVCAVKQKATMADIEGMHILEKSV